MDDTVSPETSDVSMETAEDFESDMEYDSAESELEEMLPVADCTRNVRKNYQILVEYMDPDPMLRHFSSLGGISHYKVRSIESLRTPRDKNVKLLDSVRKAGNNAYTKMKQILGETDQWLLVEYLKSSERIQGTTNVMEILTDDYIHELPSSDRILKELKLELISFYRREASRIPVSPLVETNDVPLTDIYVQPAITWMDLRYRIGDPIRYPVKSMRELFFKEEDNEPFKDIYISAEAGYGKTVFCKRVCMLWCQAHNPVTSFADSFPQDDVCCMEYFDFVFLISMRELPDSLYDLESFITAFIFEKLPPRWHERKIIDRVLNEKNCLVLLDEFDEWLHPEKCNRHHTVTDIPHRRRHVKWTILTTMRPWKYDATRLTSTLYDRLVDIHELSETSLQQLASSATSVLEKAVTAPGHQKSNERFYRTEIDTKLGKLSRLPYIYLQCICLLYENKSLGCSKCEAYANILEITLQRGIQKYRSDTALEECLKKLVPEGLNIPDCFQKKHCCVQYWGLLIKMGKLAFHTLFSAENRPVLILEVESVRNCLEYTELECGIKLGLLSQSKGYGSVARRISNLTYQHKSVQEFLAAVYFQAGVIESTKAHDAVCHLCSSLSEILELSDLLTFVCGLNSKALGEIPAIIKSTLTKEKMIIKYREGVSWLNDKAENELMCDYQTMLVECVQEMERNGQHVVHLPLQDVFVNKKTNSVQYLETLQKLVNFNSDGIKSLSIRGLQTTGDVAEVLEKLAVSNFRSLEKIYLRSVARQLDVEALLVQSVHTLRSLYLRLAKVERKELMGDTTVLSKNCEQLIVSMPLLRALYLDSMLLTHEQLETITTFITTRVTMLEVGIEQIRCSDHQATCPGLSLDLSLHGQLKLLHLTHAPLADLHVNTTGLAECFVGHLRPSLTRYWLNAISAPQKLHRLVCWELPDEVLPTLVDVIPNLHQLEYLTIGHTDLRNSVKMTSAMIHMVGLQFRSVSMTAVTFRRVIEEIDRLAQPVAVGLFSCTVTPEVEYKRSEDVIRKSENFMVLHDGLDKYGGKQFCFLKEGKRVTIGLYQPGVDWEKCGV